MTDARAAAARWAEAWMRGWEALDPEPLVACYATDACLSTEAFREPYLGRDGVRASVSMEFAEETDPRVWVSQPIVDGDRAAISWWTSLGEDGVDTTLAGTSVLRFDAAGHVVRQWDAWNQRAGRTVPPEWSPFGG